eukprot:Skav232423  [mRNA]  locus=scaffold189:103175:108628:- [translate_table: standard]
MLPRRGTHVLGHMVKQFQEDIKRKEAAKESTESTSTRDGQSSKSSTQGVEKSSDLPAAPVEKQLETAANPPASTDPSASSSAQSEHGEAMPAADLPHWGRQGPRHDDMVMAVDSDAAEKRGVPSKLKISRPSDTKNRCRHGIKPLADAADAVKFEDLLLLGGTWRSGTVGVEMRRGFQCCSLNFTGVGIEIQHDDQQQWFVPWEAMPEVFDGTWDLQVPESHPHVKQLRARFSFGFSSCTGCKFHLASCSPDQLDSISRIVQLRSSQAVAIEGLPGSETDHVEINEAQSYLDDSDVTSGSPLAITAPATLPYSSVIVTPRAPPRIEAATPQPVMSQREMIGAHSNLQMPQELLAALLDQPQVPEPLTLQHAWLHLPPFCAHFHRCLVSVDKLGLSLRPLGRSKRSSELHATGLKLLHTESLSFPLSAILDAEEVPELAPPVPMNSSGEQQTFGRQFGRKQGLIPLARLCFSRRASSKPQKPCPESAERLPAAASYFVVVKLRAGVAGKMPGQEWDENQ